MTTKLANLKRDSFLIDIDILGYIQLAKEHYTLSTSSITLLPNIRDNTRDRHLK